MKSLIPPVAILRGRLLFISSLLLTVLMLTGVGIVSYDALTIREAEEIEEDTSKLLINAEQWLNHQQAIEVAIRNYVIMGESQSLKSIEENRHAAIEHMQAMKGVLVEYQEDAENQLNKLLKFTEGHSRNVDRIIAARKAGDIQSAERELASTDSESFVNGAKLTIDKLTQPLQEKRSQVNAEVSFDVLRGGISFALMAILMIAVIWASYIVTSKTQRRSEELSEQLELEATHDALTSLPNRRYMHEHLSRAISLATRNKTRVALMVIDLDGFKPINDMLGHDAGDLVLKEVANRFKRMLRGSDFIVRTGGDEFALVVENAEHGVSIQYPAQRLVECLAAPIELPNQVRASIGCSIGIAVFPENAKTREELFAAADQAMYLAKRNGKNCWRICETVV